MNTCLKLLGAEGSGGRWRSEVVENAHFYCNKDIDRLISETEATVTQGLEGGDRQRAMKRLRVPPLGEQQSPWITFKVGLFSGAFVVMLLAVIITGENFRLIIGQIIDVTLDFSLSLIVILNSIYTSLFLYLPLLVL